MGRAEKRRFVKRFKRISGICPFCKKKSVFCTDNELSVRCVMCEQQVVDKKLEKQGFVQLGAAKGVTNGKDTNCDRPE